MKATRPRGEARPALAKCPTGIRGLDQITNGGLPRGRPTLVAGNAGCGKSLFGMEFLVRGAAQFDEPGVLMTFEETEKEVRDNTRSLGFDLGRLIERGLLSIDHVLVERKQIEETGEYDLEGLFVRLGYAIDSIGARRVVLDTIETLFSGFTDTGVLRAELRRLFRWLKDKGVTAVVTGERGEGTLTRQGLEEYVSDCVILLDNRVVDQLATRRLRVVKYRGSAHGSNEYPFLIDQDGISILPITSLGLDYPSSSERVSTGVPELDAMLGGKGLYRGTTVLVSGTAGTGKSSIAAHLVSAACARGERSLYFAFEEAQDQILRNMRSIGLELKDCVAKGLLRFECYRPTAYGLETHLAAMNKAIEELGPSIVVMDPITDFEMLGDKLEIRAMMTRMVDHLKTLGITALMTSLTAGVSSAEQVAGGISSLVDTWIVLRNLETSGEHTRGLYVLKSRGMPHSNQIREFLITEHGLRLVDVFRTSSGEALTGAERAAREESEGRAPKAPAPAGKAGRRP